MSGEFRVDFMIYEFECLVCWYCVCCQVVVVEGIGVDFGQFMQLWGRRVFGLSGNVCGFYCVG